MICKLSVPIVAALATAAVAAPANAASSDPSQLAAHCLVSKQPAKVARALNAGYGRPFEIAVKSLPVARCLGNEHEAVTPTVLRGALFAEMYRKFGPPAGRSAPTLPNNGWQANVPADAPTAGWYRLGSCIEQADPQGARALVRAETGSDEAARRMASLVPSVQKCVPAGTPLRVSRSMLTGLLAEVVYRLDSVRPESLAR